MSFYKRSFHSFLDQTNSKTIPFEPGLGRDEANGLMLCTEYLGFESYDMRMSENEVENKMTCHAEVETKRVETKRRKTKENVVVRERKREFPPPLSSLNGRGQRSFYLRPVRKDGRLELTQVMIDRPEIFRASREDGRLRLHLVDGVENPIRAYCGPEDIVALEDEPKIMASRNHDEDDNDATNDEDDNDATNDEDDNDATNDDQVVVFSMINDGSGAKSSHEVSVNSHNDVTYFKDDHDTREWRYKSCYKIMASRNHDENNHHHHHHHHIHPYHHRNSNNNMHLWTRTYVKTR